MLSLGSSVWEFRFYSNSLSWGRGFFLFFMEKVVRFGLYTVLEDLVVIVDICSYDWVEISLCL